MATATKTAPVAIDKQVKDFLKTLGSGPNKIAESLAAMKIKGVAFNSEECPIAKVVKKNFKKLRNIFVSAALEFIYKDEDYSVDLPAAVDKFITKFDNGNYPNLAIKAG